MRTETTLYGKDGKTIGGVGGDAGYLLNLAPTVLSGITALANVGIVHLSKNASAIDAYFRELTIGLSFNGTTAAAHHVAELVKTSGADPTGGTDIVSSIVKLRAGYGTSNIDFAVHAEGGLTGGTFGSSIASIQLPKTQGAQFQQTFYFRGDELCLAADEGLALVMRGAGDANLYGSFRALWVEA